MKVQRNLTLTELQSIQKNCKNKRFLNSSKKRNKKQTSAIANSMHYKNLYLSKNSFQNHTTEQKKTQLGFRKKLVKDTLFNMSKKNFSKKSTIKKAKQNNENFHISQTEKKLTKQKLNIEKTNQKKILEQRINENQRNDFLTSVDKKYKNYQHQDSKNTSHSYSKQLESFITEEIKTTLKTLGYVEGLNHSLFNKINLLLKLNGFRQVKIDQYNLIENLGQFNYQLDEFLLKQKFEKKRHREIQNLKQIFDQKKSNFCKTMTQSNIESNKMRKLINLVDKLKIQANDSLSQLSSNMSQTEYNLVKDYDDQSPQQYQEDSRLVKNIQNYNQNFETISQLNSKLSSDISSFNCMKSENSRSFFSNNKHLKDLLQDVTILKRKLKSIEQFMSYENDQHQRGFQQQNSH